MADDVTMAPAYGGMFRPPPPRQSRVAWIIIGVFLAIVLVVSACVSAIWIMQRHRRFAENGRPCVSGCEYGKCIHDNGDSYCGNECKSDGDCPSAFVCDPTLSGRHHVCLKAGAETSPNVHRRTRAH
jgi:hypothetical protein